MKKKNYENCIKELLNDKYIKIYLRKIKIKNQNENENKLS